MLAYERHGSGEPLVLVHGVGHRRQAWYPVLDLLTPYRDVILVDLPGHGESPPLVLEGSLTQTLTQTLRGFLDDIGVVRPHIGGNSLGGRIALEAALSGDVASATALSPAGFWRTRAEYTYTLALFKTVTTISARISRYAPRLVHSALGRAALVGWLTAHPTKADPELLLGDLQAFRRAQPAMSVILAEAIEFPADAHPDVPVTVAWGRRDLVLPFWQSGQAKRLLPGAVHLALPSCGHVPMNDRPRQVADILLRGSNGARAE